MRGGMRMSVETTTEQLTPVLYLAQRAELLAQRIDSTDDPWLQANLKTDLGSTLTGLRHEIYMAQHRMGLLNDYAS